MPLPAGWTEVEVFADYLDGEGNPVKGSVIFTSPQIVVIDDVTIVPRTITGVLDGNGHLSVLIPATDDPDINPIGWRWRVLERIPRLGRGAFYLDVDVADELTGIDLVQHAPLAHLDDGTPVVMGQMVSHAHPTGEVTGLDAELALRLRVRHVGPDAPVTTGWAVNDFWYDTSTEV